MSAHTTRLHRLRYPGGNPLAVLFPFVAWPELCAYHNEEAARRLLHRIDICRRLGPFTEPWMFRAVLERRP